MLPVSRRLKAAWNPHSVGCTAVCSTLTDAPQQRVRRQALAHMVRSCIALGAYMAAAHSPDAMQQPIRYKLPEGVRRQAFSHMVRSCTTLGDYMAERGPSAALDMDELLLRAAMDVIGAPPIAQLSCTGLSRHLRPRKFASAVLMPPASS